MTIFRVWWADARGKTGAVLLLVWAAALLHSFRGEFVLGPVVAVAVVTMLDATLARIRSGAFRFSLSSVVTGLLIGLIVSPQGDLTPVILAAIASSLSKQVQVTERGKHMTNPAAFGIVASSFLRPPAWWAASWGVLPIVIVSIGMAPVLWRLRRIMMPLLFLVAYVFFRLPTGVDGAIRLTLDGTVILFAWVMLPEPVTSPARGWWRYFWGMLVALLVYGIDRLGVAWGDPLLLALLGANVIGALWGGGLAIGRLVRAR